MNKLKVQDGLSTGTKKEFQGLPIKAAKYRVELAQAKTEGEREEIILRIKNEPDGETILKTIMLLEEITPQREKGSLALKPGQKALTIDQLLQLQGNNSSPEEKDTGFLKKKRKKKGLLNLDTHHPLL